MNDLEKTIKHFESLQKRYTTEHNGQMCERVADALEALHCFAEREVGYPPQATWETHYWFIDVMREILVNYRNNRTGSPMLEGYTEETCHDEWNKVIDEMIEYLNAMDENNPAYESMEFCEYENKMKEAKEKFFVLFSKYFYHFWD